MNSIIKQQTKAVKALIYKAPLPRKKQRVNHYKFQRNGKVKHFTEEEVFKENLKRVPNITKNIVLFY